MARLTATALALAGLGLTGLGLTAACSQAGPISSPPSSPAPAPVPASTCPAASASRWVDQPVSFEARGVTVYATYRHPTAPTCAPASVPTGPLPTGPLPTGPLPTGQLPAVLLIAGSGPTDRDGNTPLIRGTVGTLQTLADWLSADGVASLRYDKLDSGRTGLGPYTERPGSIGIAPFEAEAAAALRFLARQPGTDPARLGVIGHSEGALFALLLATDADPGDSGSVPPVHALGLLEPLAHRYLDIIATQIDVQVAAAKRARLYTAKQASAVTRALTTAIDQLRKTGTVPSGLPSALATVFSPVNARFLSQADRYDPATLAARLAPSTPVLVTCSNADLQVTCGEVRHLLAGLARPPASTDFVPLTGVDHVLKQDSTGSAANYGNPLPFSPQLRQALRSFVQRSL
jgi:uncharacterized protein